MIEPDFGFCQQGVGRLRNKNLNTSTSPIFNGLITNIKIWGSMFKQSKLLEIPKFDLQLGFSYNFSIGCLIPKGNRHPLNLFWMPTYFFIKKVKWNECDQI